MNRPLNRKLVLVVRIVLGLLGCGLGVLAMWQYLSAYPDKVQGGIRVVFYLASALVPGALLFLSAKPLLHLCYSMGGPIKKLLGRARPMDIAGAMLGMLVGIMLAFLAEFLLGLVLHIFALRLIIDIAVALVATYIAALLFTRLLSAGETEAEDAAPTAKRFGYLLTRSAFYDERLERLFPEWIPSAFTLACTANALKILAAEDERAAAAYARYCRLCEAGCLKTLRGAANETDEQAACVRCATDKRLKLVAKSAEAFDGAEHCAVLALASLFATVHSD